MDTEKATKAFIKLREARAVLKREWEAQDNKLKANQELIENALVQFLNENKIEKGFRTTSGLVYWEETLQPSGSDWNALYAWIKENDAFDFLERRIKRTAVSDYMKANEDALPPGVSVFRKYDIRIRKD